MSSKSTATGIGTLGGTGIGAAFGGPAGASIGGSLGSVIGSLFGSDGSQEALDAQLAQYNGIVPPDIAKALALQHYQAGGTLTPEQQQKLNLNQDQATTLTENPADRANQQSSLDALKQLSQSGMSAQDLAQEQAMRSSVAEDTQAKVQSLLQQQQQRGQADSGSTLAAQLSAVQNGNQQASHDAVQQAAAAASARQNALSQYANLSGQIRGQDYNTQKANTDNEIQRQRFLDQNSLSRQSANVSADNNAQLYNLQRAQSASDSNVGSYNQEQARQAAAKQQQYLDALALAQSKANAYGNQANAAVASGAAQAQGFAGITGGMATIAGGKNGNSWGNLFDSKTPSPTNLGTKLSDTATPLPADNSNSTYQNS